MSKVNIGYLNCSNKYSKLYKNFFKQCFLNDISDIIKKYDDIDSGNPLFKEYLIFSYLYENAGLVLNGDFYIFDDLDVFFNNDFFIAYRDFSNISSNIFWVKKVKDSKVKKIIDAIKENKYNTLVELISNKFNISLNNNYNYLIKFDDNSYIYPYEYFFPIDYENVGKSITDNTRAVYIPNQKIKIKNKIKYGLLRKIGPTSYDYLFAILRKAKNNIGYKRYIFFQKMKNKVSVKEDPGIKNTFEVLDKYIELSKNKKLEYIIIHNPNWLGVTSATKELFVNLVPIEEVYLDKNINKIVDYIIRLNINQVIFSAFDYGWDKIAIKIREINPNIKIKSFWHGSHSQVIEEINWETNLMVINLHKQKIIDVMGTCKESLVDFYKSQGYNAAFIKNTVRLDSEIKNKVNNIKKEETSYIKFGLYSAGTDWRKNTYNQVIAASLFNNAELEVVPLRYDLEKLAYYNELKIVGSTSHLKRDDLLVQMAKRDIVLYVTFSECAPMLPIESLEVGTICIMGDNHHYFKGTKLHDYLVVSREDDLNSICKKIRVALDNKDEIFDLYKKWKMEYDKESLESVSNFLNM